MVVEAAIVQARAVAYLFEHGRVIDQARYRARFDGAPVLDVLAALDDFQNADGGFGHGLEPDIRTGASSVIATTMAFEILREVNAFCDEPMVVQGMAFLCRAFDKTLEAWPMVPAAVEDAPHAPWWTYTDTQQNFDGFKINPSAAVVGYLLDHAALVDDARWLEDQVMAVVDRITGKGSRMDMHEFLAALVLQATPQLPTPARAAVEATLAAAIPVLVAEPNQWPAYTLQPLDAAPAPDSFAAQMIDPLLLQENLNYWLQSQSADGSWPLPWQWAFVDEAAWAQAERDWKGYQIVKRLKTLHAYGRLG